MANPILGNVLEKAERAEGNVMTLSGTLTKSLILAASVILSAVYVWTLATAGYTDKANLLGVVGGIAAFISGLIVVLARPKISPILSFVYAIGEGFCLGMISSVFESYAHGIVMKAVFCTLMTLGVMLALYSMRIIRCTDKFRATVITATASILLIYIIQLVATLFSRSIPVIFTASTGGIVFSLFIIAVAASNFIIDFDSIERGCNSMIPKIYEWVCSLGLMFTLVWLYVEFLHLFLKIQNR